jgi:hypothetical protein
VLAVDREDDEAMRALLADPDADLAMFLADVVTHLFAVLAERDDRGSAEALILEWQQRTLEGDHYS